MTTEFAVEEVSRHKCLIYEGHPSEQLPVIVPLLQEGLKENRRCLYLGNPQMVGMVDSALSAKGVDTSREARRGALVLSSDRGHLDGGGFDPRAMVAMLCSLIDQAVRDGFTGLCATGDMMWELGTEKNFDRLLEYEALLEQVFRDKPLMGICQYRLDAVPPRALRDALLTHRSAFIGSELNRDNLFYVPPELLQAGSDAEARDKQGEWMCRQITRIARAEQGRDRALAALRASEAEQRRLVEMLAEANRGLERRVRERTQELETLNQELEAFSYSVSHDLRAPLRHVDGFVGLLRKHAASSLDETGRKYLDTISDSARRMGKLIDDLLSFSRMARAEMRRIPQPLGALVDEVIRDLKPETEGRRVTWKIGNLPEVECDPALMRPVFANLLGNAVKFTRPRDEAVIEIGYQKKPGEAVVFVRDNGVGFDPGQARKLFGVFQRLHSQAEFEGTGIGLANVRRIVRRHGGEAWAESEPGKGAVFYFSLPDRAPQA